MNTAVNFRFRFEDRWFEIKGTADQTLVDMTVSNDIRSPHACLEGGCGSCKGKLLQGQVQLGPNDILTAEDVADGYILACQSRAVTPSITVDFDIE